MPDYSDLSDDTMYRVLVQGVMEYAIYMLDPDGTVLNWNEGAKRAKGYEAHEIVGKHFSVFYSADDRTAGTPDQVLETARATGRFEGKGWRVREDGSRFWAHVVIDAIRASDGTIIGFAKITRDLTEVNRQADELATVSHSLDLALSHMSQGLIMFDADEKLVLCNDRWRALFGLRDSDAPTGTTFADLIRVVLTNGGRTISEPIIDRIRQKRLRKIAGTTTSEEIRFADRTLLMNYGAIPNGGWVTTVDDITRRRAIEDRIRHLAHHDSLTDLPNRMVVHDTIRAILQERSRDSCCALLYLDLDRFKPVNDSFGHAAGDVVLRTIANRIKSELRNGDVAGRLGGDEFVIVIPDCTGPRSAVALASRLILAVGEPIVMGNSVTTVGASIGIAVAPPSQFDADVLLHNADLALYRAKATGRNRAVVYDPGIERHLNNRRQLERDLRQALADQRFNLHYQPIVDLEERSIVGFEALLRWDRPDHGPVSPADFVPFAEEIGLMAEIDEWVIERACADATAWENRFTISVNLSPVSMRKPDLTDRIATILSTTGLPADRLEIEITETAAIYDLDAAREILNTLRTMGVQIALDDFGTGHSSLGMVRTLPFTRIKIDRSFVQDMEQNPQAAVVVRAICGICRGLNVRATAEGVETLSQARQLLLEGCKDFQGYLLSRPLPVEEVAGFADTFAASTIPFLQSLSSATSPCDRVVPHRRATASPGLVHDA